MICPARMEEERTYHSVSDMRRRKRQLKSEIAASGKVVGHLWNDLFHKHGGKRSTPRARRLSDVVSTGVSVVDGALLVWKLYRRFRK